MLSPFLGIFGTFVVLMGLCRAGNLDRSDLEPPSIVYTIYPYYNSETLLNVWNAEEPVQIDANIVQRGRDSETQQGKNEADPTTRGGSSEIFNNRDSVRNNSNEARLRSGQATEITYWPPIQRGATPKLRLARPNDDVQSKNFRNGV